MWRERESKGGREGGREGRSAGARKRGNRRWERERQASKRGGSEDERKARRKRKGEGGVVESDRQRHTVTAKKRENNRETPTNCQVKANIFSF